MNSFFVLSKTDFVFGISLFLGSHDFREALKNLIKYYKVVSAERYNWEKNLGCRVNKVNLTDLCSLILISA